MDVTLLDIMHQAMVSLNLVTFKFSLLLIITIAFGPFVKEILAFEPRENFVFDPKVKVVITNDLDASVTPKIITVH